MKPRLRFRPPVWYDPGSHPARRSPPVLPTGENDMFGWDVSVQDIDHLIARGKYAKAVKPLRSLLKKHPEDFHLRQKLADVLAPAHVRQPSLNGLGV